MLMETTLLAFDFTPAFTQLFEAFSSTLKIFILTIIFAMPLGMIVAMGRMSKFKPLQLLTKLYISIMRGTPLMLQLIVVFFAPNYLFKVSISDNYRFWAVIIGFAINYAAYFAEIYRGGIEAIPRGQYEAAQILGFSKGQTFFKIILPQVAKIILPSITNEIITLVKDTSLAYSISYVEMFVVAKQLVTAQSSIAPLFVAGAFYYVMNLVVAYIMGKFEKRMNKYD